MDIGSELLITDLNKDDISISVADTEDEEINGIEDIPTRWNEPASWDENLNHGTIQIRAVVQDAAGNKADWTTTSTLEIDGITSTDRPTITSATAANENGWWGPNSSGLPIQIELTADEAITVDENDGTPSIQLETGTTVGVANYVSGSESTILVFDYNPGAGEVSDDLAFKLLDRQNTTPLDPDDDEAIIFLNGSMMHSIGGNYLQYGDLNTSSPLLPKPNDDTEETGEDVKLSLDENKDLIIDGVAP